MEAKQISLFCLLLAAFAGKIETKPSGSLSALSAEQETLLGAQQGVLLGTNSLDISGYSDTLGNYGQRGIFGQDLTGCSSSLGNYGRQGSFGQGLASGGSFTPSLGQQGIGNQGLGGGFDSCQQGIGRIFTPGCNIYGGGFDQQLSTLGFNNLAGIGQSQQLNSGLGNLGTSQGSNLDISALTGRFNDAGLDYLYSPCTSCNQVGTQDLGFNNILGNSRGCLSGSQGIPFGTGCGTYQQSLSPFTTGCNDFDLSCQQGITASASCGVCQGITGTTGRGACQGITGTTGSGYCQSCQSTPICDDTCDSTCTDAVLIVAPVEVDCCDCGDGTVVTDPCRTC